MLPHRLDGRLLFSVFVIYALSVKGYVESLDTVYSIATAESIVSRGRLDVQVHRDGYTRVGTEGKYYSKYGIGLPLYLTPFIALGHAAAKVTGLPEADLSGFLISFSQVPLALLILVLFARQLSRFGAPRENILLLTAALGLGTLCWHYATCDFSELMQAAFLLGAYYGVVEQRRSAVSWGGAAFGALVLVKLVHIALLPLFLIYLLMPSAEDLRDRLARVALFLAPVALAGLVIASFNLVRFGNIFESGYGHEASLFLPAQLWYTLPALLFSLDKGLLAFSPVLILGLFGVGGFRRRHPRESTLCLAIVAVTFLLVGAWHSWGGGWSWGPRLLVPVIPLWSLAGGFALDRQSMPRRNLAVVALIVASILLQVPGILVNDQEIHRIKDILLSQDEQPQALGDLPMAWVLAWHKIHNSSERYNVSSFGVQGDRQIDLNAYRSFRGVDVWTEHAARQLDRPWLRLLPLVGLGLVGLLTLQRRSAGSTGGLV